MQAKDLPGLPSELRSSVGNFVGYGTAEHWLQVYYKYWKTNLPEHEFSLLPRLCYLDVEQLDRALAFSPVGT